MKRVLYILCLLFCIVLGPYVSQAQAETATVLITHIQTDSLVSASDEYITITNTSESTVTLDGMYLEYFSAGAADFSTPSRSVELSGTIESKMQLYATSTVAVNKDVARWVYSATLASSGGHVRLVQRTVDAEIVLDLVGWGTAAMPESESAVAQAKGVPYVRRSTTEGFQDTNNNKNDFTPLSAEPVSPTPNTQTQVTTSLPEVTITELLPDPASPLTDANDEYIELYNASSQVVALTGFVLQTGTNFSYSFTLEQEYIPARSYKVLYAVQTGLSLSNSGGRARLLTASGEVVDETAQYEKAPTGESWTMLNGVWQWADSSPFTVGVAMLPEEESSTVASSTKKTATKTTSKAATKTAATTKAKKETETAAKPAYTAPTEDNKKVPVNPLILAGVGVFALGYMIYEYKSDIYLRFKQLRRNKPARS